MRDFYVGLGGGPKTRNAKPSTWSVDLSVIDLPTDGEVVGFDGIPSWNVLRDDHIKFSLVVASTVMDDMGWVLVLCPSTSLVRVERMAIRAGLQLSFIWILESSEPFSSMTRCGHTQKMGVFYAMAFHKVGLDPPFEHLSAQKIGEVMQQDLSIEVIGHYLPSSSRVRRNGKSGGWRGTLEKSTSHTLLFMEALCPRGGTILEVGGGTRLAYWSWLLGCGE
ncbi:hypothetical protein GOP47_0005490 [Adiantum capillus-veneris]|uniref:Uncharacterized protein n=1 Tax=Adiantum capillus-veneris TaxID=13818 RepID=A0A9D4V567_ADICA|nr:hypothetical protein GOP47_0005490 [Adiantum capillus-veneris]